MMDDVSRIFGLDKQTVSFYYIDDLSRHYFVRIQENTKIKVQLDHSLWDIHYIKFSLYLTRLFH